MGIDPTTLTPPSPDHHLHGGPPWVWCKRNPCPTINDIVSTQQMTARPVGPDGKPLWDVVFVSRWYWRWLMFKARVTWWLWRRWTHKGRAQRRRTR